MSPDFQTFSSPLSLSTTPSGVSMLWQKLSVRVSPRLRGSSFYSEWEIIVRDNVLVGLCRHRYRKERKNGEKKKVTGTVVWVEGYDPVDATVVYGSNYFLWLRAFK